MEQQEIQNTEISVIIPTYNQAEFLAGAIDSVLAQTFQKIEVIVVDDGSTDHTSEVAASYGSKIRYVRKTNGGTGSALNRGIQEATAPLIAWLSSDDQFLPEKLSLQLAEIKKNPPLGVVYTDWYNVDRQGRILEEVHCLPPPNGNALLSLILYGCFINGSTILVRKQCFDRVGFFEEGRDAFAHDWVMWIKLARHFQFGSVPKPLMRYTIHAAADSFKRQQVILAAHNTLQKMLMDIPQEEIFPQLQELQGNAKLREESKVRTQLGDSLMRRQFFDLAEMQYELAQKDFFKWAIRMRIQWSKLLQTRGLQPFIAVYFAVRRIINTAIGYRNGLNYMVKRNRVVLLKNLLLLKSKQWRLTATKVVGTKNSE